MKYRLFLQSNTCDRAITLWRHLPHTADTSWACPCKTSRGSACWWLPGSICNEDTRQSKLHLMLWTKKHLYSVQENIYLTKKQDFNNFFLNSNENSSFPLWKHRTDLKVYLMNFFCQYIQIQSVFFLTHAQSHIDERN